MARTREQTEALVWYIETNDLLPQLSAHPKYRFKKRGGVEIFEKSINAIVSLWKAAKDKK